MKWRLLKLDWSYAIGELIIVTAGVLLAFAINAWWEDLGNNRSEQDILEGLHEEFNSTLDNVRNAKAGELNRSQAAQQVLALIGPESSELNDEVVKNKIVAILGSNEDFKPTESTLESLVNSQGLAIISNYDLRVRLSGWPKVKSSVEFYDQRIADLYQQRILPFIGRKVPIRTLDAINDPNLEPSKFPFNHENLLTDLEFESMVNDLYYYSYKEVEELTKAENEIIGILDILQTEQE